MESGRIETIVSLFISPVEPDDNWSARIEYRYTDYGRFNNFPVTSDAGDPITYHIQDSRVQVGFSYKFGVPLLPAPPVVAKY